MVDLEFMDIVMGVNSMCGLLSTQKGNDELKRVLNEHYDDAYMAVESKHVGNLATEKQAISYAILNLMEADGYRFVTAVSQKDNYKWFETTHKDIMTKIQLAFCNLTRNKKKKTKKAVVADGQVKINSFSLKKK